MNKIYQDYANFVTKTDYPINENFPLDFLKQNSYKYTSEEIYNFILEGRGRWNQRVEKELLDYYTQNHLIKLWLT